MRTGTGFDADQAGRRIGKESQQFASAEGFLEHGFPMLIDAVNLEDRLGNIKTDADNFHGTPPWQAHCPMAAMRSVSRWTGGGVHFIRLDRDREASRDLNRLLNKPGSLEIAFWGYQ